MSVDSVSNWRYTTHMINIVEKLSMHIMLPYRYFYNNKRQSLLPSFLLIFKRIKKSTSTTTHPINVCMLPRCDVNYNTTTIKKNVSFLVFQTYVIYRPIIKALCLLNNVISLWSRIEDDKKNNATIKLIYLFLSFANLHFHIHMSTYIGFYW